MLALCVRLSAAAAGTNTEIRRRERVGGPEKRRRKRENGKKYMRKRILSKQLFARIRQTHLACRLSSSEPELFSLFSPSFFLSPSAPASAARYDFHACRRADVGPLVGCVLLAAARITLSRLNDSPGYLIRCR